jgi:hypothetical protein
VRDNQTVKSSAFHILLFPLGASAKALQPGHLVRSVEEKSWELNEIFSIALLVRARLYPSPLTKSFSFEMRVDVIV